MDFPSVHLRLSDWKAHENGAQLIAADIETDRTLLNEMACSVEIPSLKG